VRVDMERRQVDLGLVDILENVRREGRGIAPRSRTAAATPEAAAGFTRRQKKQRPGRRERAAKKSEPHGRSRSPRRR